ncbi:MAG: hypothetical protein HQM06_15335 [Magnetococcales bacterium]|nr:hypothetical protein [Magnetococcales bacterium]
MSGHVVHGLSGFKWGKEVSEAVLLSDEVQILPSDLVMATLESLAHSYPRSASWWICAIALPNFLSAIAILEDVVYRAQVLALACPVW